MDHVATFRRVYDLLNAGDIEGLGELLAEDFVEHVEPPGWVGPVDRTKDGVKQWFHIYRMAYPDLFVEVQDVVVSGDKVVARVRATGTNDGVLKGRPATGEQIDVQFIDIVRFGDDGLAHEHWGVLNSLDMTPHLEEVPV